MKNIGKSNFYPIFRKTFYLKKRRISSHKEMYADSNKSNMRLHTAPKCCTVHVHMHNGEPTCGTANSKTVLQNTLSKLILNLCI